MDEKDEVFCPSALRCLECYGRVSLEIDSFMASCCGMYILCYECCRKNRNLKCSLCKHDSKYVRVGVAFFKSILNETALWVDRKCKEQMSKFINTGKVQENPRGDILVRVVERPSENPNVKVKQVSHMIHDMLKNFKHSKECQPYQNISYVCETFVKLRKVVGITITVHDILAYLCMFCGHGSMNQVSLSYGEVRQLNNHAKHECAKECCGRFLDRRYLQFLGGDCECGLVLMDQLGIRPASEEENEWRKNLFIGRGSVKNHEVRSKLAETLKALKIGRPQLLIWYIMSKGGRFLDEILALGQGERVEKVRGLIIKLNKEYGRHQPIQ